ncbi:MAG TPA: hypothetical protein VJ916_00570 [Anaerovoracaceae bacterium]|nr:hypothetical protein [Anaerovoracaceae bacterium]
MINYGLKSLCFMIFKQKMAYNIAWHEEKAVIVVLALLLSGKVVNVIV